MASKSLFAVCQTNYGEIDRLLAVNGQELSPDQRHAEDQRIEKMINQPGQMRWRQKEQHEDAIQERKLMRMFPDAFHFQYEVAQGSLTKLKFTPNPSFHPSGHRAKVFHNMEGILLVDNQQKHLAEISWQLTSKVTFFGGLLGHLDKGGTFVVRQQDMGSGHWELTSMDIEMKGRERSRSYRLGRCAPAAATSHLVVMTPAASLGSSVMRLLTALARSRLIQAELLWILGSGVA